MISERAVAGTEALDGRHVAARPTSRMALQGFTFSFSNSDHHLEQVAVDLASASDAPVARVHPVYFKDNNWDDPMQWAVEFVTLRVH